MNLEGEKRTVSFALILNGYYWNLSDTRKLQIEFSWEKKKIYLFTWKQCHLMEVAYV